MVEPTRESICSPSSYSRWIPNAYAAIRDRTHTGWEAYFGREKFTNKALVMMATRDIPAKLSTHITPVQ